MANIAKSATDLIGNTPLLELQNYSKAEGAENPIIAKLEYFNPLSSVKDRIGYALIKDGEERGLIKEGTVIIEPTSGNTGIGLAAVAAAKGYRVILTMPETMSVERRRLLAAYGAQLVLTPGAQGMQGAIQKTEELAAQTPGSFVPGQFVNPQNPEVHYRTTGPEIWEDTDGQVNIFVAGVGTGGTISGVGKYLKEQNPAVKVVAVEPANSAVLSGKAAGAHGLQGIGAGFVPDTLDTTIYDAVMPIYEQDAYETGRMLATKVGLLVGITAGAVVYAAIQLAKDPENVGKTIVTLLPDGGEKYLTTPMFEESNEN